MRFVGFFLTTMAATFTIATAHECHDFQIASAMELVSLFGLARLPDGSYCKETHRSDIEVIANPEEGNDLSYKKSSSANLFVLTAEENDYEWSPSEDEGWSYGISYFHKLNRDETWHFYFGDTIYLYELDNSAENDMRVIKLGSNFTAGEVLEHTVNKGTWCAAQVNPSSVMEEPYSVGGTIFATAFEEGDWELADAVYDYRYFEFIWVNAAEKIKELSFSLEREADDSENSFAMPGMSSLCEDEWPLLEDLIDTFNMDGAPKNGYFVESYHSEVDVITTYGGLRSAMTSIYYAMNETVNFHRQESDETLQFYFGEPIILYEIDLEEIPRILRAIPVGSDVSIGEVPQYTVKAGHWMALEFKNGNKTYWNMTNTTPYAFLGLSNGPGFDEEDLEFGEPDDLKALFPEFSETIEALSSLGTALGTVGEVAPTNLTASAAQSGTRSSSNNESNGIVALYVFIGLAMFGMLAVVVLQRIQRRRHNKDIEDIPHGVTVIVERGDKISNIETITGGTQPRSGSVKTIDFAGIVHG